MKKLITSVLVTIAVLLLITALFTFISEKKASEVAPEENIVKDAFIDGCMETSIELGYENSEEMCVCVYDNLEDYYGQKGILDMASEYGGDLPDEVMLEVYPIIKDCI
jgi:hypothetical protein